MTLREEFEPLLLSPRGYQDSVEECARNWDQSDYTDELLAREVAVATAVSALVLLRQAAAALGNYRLSGAIVYVTIEPCLMCVGALVHARVREVVAALGAGDVLAIKGSLGSKMKVIVDAVLAASGGEARL